MKSLITIRRVGNLFEASFARNGVLVTAKISTAAAQSAAELFDMAFDYFDNDKSWQMRVTA